MNNINNDDHSDLEKKNEIGIRKLFVEMENIVRKFGLQINREKTEYMIVGRKTSLKKNKI
jgi:hypothetical protein